MVYVATPEPLLATRPPPIGDSPSPMTRSFDVLIVGAGISGSVAAVALGRAGYSVALIDRYAECPAQFRVEKVTGKAIDTLRELDLLDTVKAVSTPFDRVINVRRGRVLDETHALHYGVLYQDLVRAVRSRMPSTVSFQVGRAIDIETGPERQVIRLATGETFEGRIVVLATGMADFLREKVGIERRIRSEKHSISFGFNLAPADPGANDHALTYYGDGTRDRIDYLSLFPIGDVMRANLFTFRDSRDPWIGSLMREPKATLLATLPDLGRFLPEFEVQGPVQSWVMDLCGVEDHRRDGVVLIGDAFQTSCPASGMGVSRLMTDVERLCSVHLPHWMETEGMGVDKIAEFYADSEKQVSDWRALKSSRYRRALTIDTGLRGAVRRQREFLPRRLASALQAFRR